MLARHGDFGVSFLEDLDRRAGVMLAPAGDRGQGECGYGSNGGEKSTSGRYIHCGSLSFCLTGPACESLEQETHGKTRLKALPYSVLSVRQVC